MAKKKYEPKTTGRMAISHPKVLYTCKECNQTSWREHLIESNNKLICPHCLANIQDKPSFFSLKEYLDYVAPIRLY